MNHQPTSAVAARVSTPSGLVVGIPEGSRWSSAAVRTST